MNTQDAKRVLETALICAQVPLPLRELQAVQQRLEADARFLVRYVDSGRGTLGGFNQDMQIFDELKDMSRIIKQQSWRLLIKRREPLAPVPPRPVPPRPAR